MEQDTENYKIKVHELNLQEMHLRKDKLLEIIKIITTGVVVTLIPTIINYQIQHQEIEIKRLEGEIVYLEKFSSNVVEQDDLAKRRNFVQYLATIAHSEDSRERWGIYLEIVKKLAQEQENIDSSISLKEIEAEKALNTFAKIKSDYEKAKKEKSSELAKLESDLIEAKSKIKEIDQELLAKTKDRETLIKKSRLSSKEINLETQIQNLVFQMNSPNRSTRLSAVANLIKNHRSSGLAISSALDLLKLPQLETLSASGRINVLVFLRNTNPNSWNGELRERGYSAIELIQSRSKQDAYIGPQTEDALTRFKAFLKNNITSAST